eukprot:tig00000681_g3073.t1
MSNATIVNLTTVTAEAVSTADRIITLNQADDVSEGTGASASGGQPAAGSGLRFRHYTTPGLVEQTGSLTFETASGSLTDEAGRDGRRPQRQPIDRYDFADIVFRIAHRGIGFLYGGSGLMPIKGKDPIDFVNKPLGSDGVPAACQYIMTAAAGGGRQ